MSHYLSDIASRSTGNDTHSLRPSTPVFAATDHGIVQDFTDEVTIPDNTGQNQFVQQNIIPVQPIQSHKVQQSDVTSRTDTPMPEKNIELSYFSKHLERLEPDQEKSPVKNQSHETGSFKIEEPSQKIATEGSSEKSMVNETIIHNKIISNIISGNKDKEKQTSEIIDLKPNVIIHDDEIIVVKRQTINPSVNDEIIAVKRQAINPSETDEDQRNSKLQPNRSYIEILMPSQLNQEKPRQFLNKTNQAKPKLVIGKIIVEILPPIAPIPSKTITRFVQPSSDTGPSKSNKLSFGLGQL